MSADQLIDALWGEAPPPSAPKILQGCVVRLRKLLGAGTIETSAHGYLLAVSPDQLDALDFARVVEQARELLILGEADRAAYQLNEALAWWRGDAFTDLESWSPAQTEVRRLGELRLEAEELRIDALLRAGRPREVLAEAQSLVRDEPLRERRWILLAQAQYQSGQQGDALRTIHRLRAVLVEQLGIDPGPEVAELEDAILRQDPSLLVTGDPGSAHTTCPYPGLRSFDVDDADRFFGRQHDVVACLAILARAPLLALVGPSGSGKSSILRAGVAAALRRHGTPTLLLTPGPRPQEALTGLAGRPAGTTLLIDQFEEVFTLCADPDEQRAFLRALGTEAGRRTVVIALRADHLVDLAAHHDFSRLVEQGLYLVGGLSDDGLRDAIELPARQAGLIIEPGLVDLLVREVEGDPGALPLVSHALLETWKRREGNTLTVAGYRATGGMHDAIAQSAERLYAGIGVEQRHLLRDLLLRLVSPGPQGQPVRSRVPRRLVATDPDHDQLIEMLVDARLVTSDDGVLEITHEALARAWPRLRGWLDDDVEGQRTRHHLTSAADAWDSLGRPDSELYRGVRLTRAQDWQQHTTTTLTDTERDFLHAARRLAEAEERSTAERARIQARLIRRLRLVLAGAVALLVLALVAGGAAVVQSRTASHNAAAATTAEASAQQEALRAQVRGALARAAATDDVDEALTLTLGAARLDPSTEAFSGLMGVLAQYPALTSSLRVPGSENLAIDAGPGGRVVTVDTTHRVSLVDLGTQRVVASRQVGRPRRENDDIRPVQLSPDGRMVAVGRTPLGGRPLVLLDGRTLAPLPAQPGGLPPGRWQAADVYFSRDGQHLAVALRRIRQQGDTLAPVATVAAVWTLSRPDRPRLVHLPTGGSYVSVALSPDGDTLYALPARRAYDVSTGNGQVFFRGSVDADVDGLDLSPDGRLLAFDVPGRRQTVLVDTTTDRVVRRLPAKSLTSDARFSADGSRLLTTNWGAHRNVQVWDVSSGRPVTGVVVPSGSEQAVDFEPDGTRVVTGGALGVLRVWDVDGDHRYLRRIPVRGLPWAAAHSPGGACFATPSDDSRFVMYLPCPYWDPSLEGAYAFLDVARRQVHVLRHVAPGWSFGAGSWRAGRPEFVRADGGYLRSFDGRTGRPEGPARHPLGNRVSDVDHTPDGRLVVAAEQSGRITLLDAGTLRPVGRQVHLHRPTCCVSAGADDHTAFVVTGFPTFPVFWMDPAHHWALVDLRSGTVLREGDVDVRSVAWAAYSPDGRHAAVTGADGDVEILDLTTGRPVAPALLAHQGGSYWATFSADGSRLVTTGVDGSVVLWDTDTGAEIGRITTTSASFVSAGFLRGGHALLVVPWVGSDPAVYVWRPGFVRALDFGCRALGRSPTRTEWKDAFGDTPYVEVCPGPSGG